MEQSRQGCLIGKVHTQNAQGQTDPQQGALVLCKISGSGGQSVRLISSHTQVKQLRLCLGENCLKREAGNH